MSDGWKPPQQRSPLDQQAVHEAVFSAMRANLRMYAEENIPTLTGETLTIWRELCAIRSVLRDISLWTAIGALALLAIAAKLWLF